jgi:hypothetical protein
MLYAQIVKRSGYETYVSCWYDQGAEFLQAARESFGRDLKSDSNTAFLAIKAEVPDLQILHFVADRGWEVHTMAIKPSGDGVCLLQRPN